MHVACEPSILYFGTPVVLVSTLNEDGTPNIAPFSSVFWLGWRCVLGIGNDSQTAKNLSREKECVVCLPSVDQVSYVNRLALTTGNHEISPRKAERGYKYVKEKFPHSGLTPSPSETVSAKRVAECPVHLEAVWANSHMLSCEDEILRGRITLFELRVTRVSVLKGLLDTERTNHIDPDKWKPLIMSFQKFYGITETSIHESRLSKIPEILYRSSDIDKATSR